MSIDARVGPTRLRWHDEQPLSRSPRDAMRRPNARQRDRQHRDALPPLYRARPARNANAVCSSAALSTGCVLIVAALLGPPGDAVASSCPGAFVGTPGLPPSIEITDVPLGGGSGTVRGIARNVDPTKVRISGWAHTDRYYPQPLLTDLFTCVAGDGSWSYVTQPGKRVIALLVDDAYVGPAGPPPLPSSIDYHPATDRGVVASAERPPSRTVRFAGKTWWVKDSAPFPTAPGPCVFSPEPANVFVDSDGLHLKIIRQDAGWTCAEVVLDRSRGLGDYTFQVAGGLDAMDPYGVFGAFLFESTTREIDIECSPALTGLPNGCQYGVQPATTAGNRRAFPISAGPSTHRISWRADRIEFLSWRGFQPFPPASQDVIAQFVYTGPDVPPPGHERMRLNLWLFNGSAPANGTASEIVVRSFDYSCPAQGCPSTSTVAAVLPLSRSHQVGTAVTAFATMINTGTADAVHCRVQLPVNPPAGLGSFTYQATDASTNVATAAPNMPQPIAPGALQTFVFGFTPAVPMTETALAMRFQCDNAPDAPHIAGVNDFTAVADAAPVPDTIALAATPTRDGVVRIPGPTGLQPFAIGTANVGATGDITVSADTGAAALPVTLSVCETDAGSGTCLAPPAPALTVTYSAGSTRSFAVFVQASGAIAFAPEVNRVFARLTQHGVARGLTSAAVCTTPSAGC